MRMSQAQRELAGRSVVLVVDDLPGNIELLGNLLREAGLKVAVATSGAMAIAVANAKPPDIVLMDIQMPGMDGFTACEKLKECPATAEIPVIFLTAHTGEEEIVHGFAVGGVDYVTKPFRSEELLARILTHLELKQSRERILQQNEHLQELNRRLTASEESLREANAMKDRFFSIIAHDLRSPLSAFASLTEIFTDPLYSIDESEKMTLVANMRTSASNLYALLENLLTWARSQTGRIRYAPEEETVARIAAHAVNLQLPGARQKGVAILMEIPVDALAFFDCNMVGTIFRNLLSNAIRFTPEGGTIRIFARERGEHLEISVADTGTGMSAGTREKLFRIDVADITVRSDDNKGTGLGLILCREFVQRHDGEIWAESEPGKGSTFTFSLPLTGRASEEPPPGDAPLHGG